MAQSSFELKGIKKEEIGNNPEAVRSIYLFFTGAKDGRLKFFTGKKVKEKDWVESGKRGTVQRLNPKVTGAQEVNIFLDGLDIKINKAYNDFVLQGTKPTKAQLEQILKGKDAPAEVTFFSLYKETMKTLSTSAKKTWNKVLGHLEGFNKMYNYNLNWDRLDQDFYNNYIKYLSEEVPNPRKGKGGKGLFNNTLSKDITRIKRVCRLARSRGIKVPSEVEQFKTMSNQTKRAFITEERLDELMRLNIQALSEDTILKAMDHEKESINTRKIGAFKLEKLKENLEKVRDCYLFTFYAGIRHSDGYSIIPEQIVYDTDENGKMIQVIDFSQVKGKKYHVVPLNNICQELLRKYQGKQRTAMPFFCNQFHNRLLKRLFRLAGFNNKITLIRYSNETKIVEVFEEWQLLTSHTGRHSAATNILDQGGNLQTAQQLLGQSSIKSTEIYAKMSRKKINTSILNITDKRNKVS